MPSADATSVDLPLEGPTDATARRYWITTGPRFSVRRVGPIRHNYHEHPLMQLERLKQLAHSLFATRQCRFIVPGSIDSSKLDHTGAPADGRSLEEVFEHIDEPGRWIALFNVQTDPVYRAFLWEVMRSTGLLASRDPPLDVRGFIFMSSPPSVTPFHIDRENNFWLQIRGRKTLTVWDHRDRETVSARDVEDFISSGTLKNVRLKDEVRQKALVFDSGPGDGVYFPATSPHLATSDTSWVTPGNGVAISIGAVYYTRLTRRTGYAHAFNHVLRSLGMDPPLAGSSDWLDRMTYPLGRVVVALRRRFRDYVPPPGF